jgi:hypothetical protein
MCVTNSKEVDLSHLTEQQVAQYGQKKLSVTELLTVDEHLSDCAECRKHVLFFIQSLQGSSKSNLCSHVNPHLVYRDHVKYFSGKLSDERMEYCLNHVIWCEPCRLDLLDFSTFYSHLNQFSDELTPTNKRSREGLTSRPNPSTRFTAAPPEQFFESSDD